MLIRTEIRPGMLVRVAGTPIGVDGEMAACNEGRITLIHPKLDMVIVEGRWVSYGIQLAEKLQFVAFADLLNYNNCICCNSNFVAAGVSLGLKLESGAWLCVHCAILTCNAKYPNKIG